MNSKNLGRSFWSLNITQFLGAFNDNAFKMLISLIAVKIVRSEVEASRLVALAGAAFIIPQEIIEEIKTKKIPTCGFRRLIVLIRWKIFLFLEQGGWI